MTLEAGRQLLHYRLMAKIGEGGMGVVWRAEDTTLHREVAIKVVPDALAADAERLARFAREARLLATLSHPNIAAVYGLHEADGVHFLAMELVRGEDLSERIARGPLPVDEALRVAREIAEALRSAHASGVIHRDLKPANVRIGPEGEVKVLDFGLAKAFAAEGEGSSPGTSPALSPTVTSLGTVAGVLLGTAAYMSPEQARGRAVDKRADVWALGCVLFEMLAGRLVFPGETITDTLAAVVRAEPEWERLPADLPRGVRQVLRLCLAKDPRERLHDVADAALLLEGAAEDEATGMAAAAAPPAPRSRRREAAAWTLAVAAIVAALALALRPDADGGAPAPVRFTVDLGEDAPLSLSDTPILAVSHDGRTIAFSAKEAESGQSRLYLRTLDQSEPWPLLGTDGGVSPFFSPDGEQLAFFAGGELKRISLGGGSPTTLASAPNPRGGAWLGDGTIVYSPEYASGLWSVAAAGGAPRSVAEPDRDRGERTFRWPTALPGGKVVLSTVGAADTPNDYDRAMIVAFSLEDGTRKTLIEGANMARFAPPDTLVYSRGGTLYAVGLDPRRVELRGEPVRVLDGVGGDPSSGAGFFDLSSAGDLVYVTGAVSDAEATLVLVENGEAAPLPIEPRGFYQPRFSRDGSAIAFAVGRGTVGVGGDVWVYTFADESLRRVTFGGSDIYPLWHPDGSRIAYVDGAEARIVSKPADGSGEPELLVRTDPDTVLPGSWSPDGRTIAVTRVARTTDVHLLDVAASEMRLVVEDASAPAISPDGRWLAYQSPASGNSTIFVRPMEGEGKWQVSPALGSYPRWSADGRMLFYVDTGEPGRPLMEVAVQHGPAFRYGNPRVALRDLSLYQTSTSPMINWDTDGKRFVFVELARDADALLRIEVDLRWADGLSLGGRR